MCVRKSIPFKFLGVLSGMVFLVIQMSSSGEKGASPAIPSAITDTNTGAPNPSAQPEQSIIASGVVISSSGLKLAGLPEAYSSQEVLSVTLSGENLVGFQYALGTSSCNEISLSDTKAPGFVINSSVGTDGAKILCITAEVLDAQGLPKITWLSHSWIKDSIAPVISFTTPSVMGPRLISNELLVISGLADELGSELQSVQLTVNSASGCSQCPLTLAADFDNNGTFTANLPTDGLASSVLLSIDATAVDLAGNVSQVGSSVQWDAVAPANVSSINASAGEEQVALNWTSVSGASTYVVVRRKNAEVDAVIQQPALEVGDALANDALVACVTTSYSCLDQNLEEFAWYHYQVFAMDLAGNSASDGARASAQPAAKKKFRGLNYAYVIGPDRRIGVDFQLFTPSGVAANDVEYGLFAGEESDPRLTGSEVANVNAPTANYTDTGSSDIFLTVSTAIDQGPWIDNLRELRIKYAPGTHHKIAANGRFHGQDPTSQAYLLNAAATAYDPFGNLIFSVAPGSLAVICTENIQGQYCRGRIVGKIYTIAGTDGMDDGADESLASATPMGDIFGIAFDGQGNLFISDATYARVRAVCYDPTAPGFCNAKKLGFVYHVAGSGASADGLDDGIAKVTAIGTPYSLAVDALGNVFIADSVFRKLRVACAAASGAICGANSKGRLYTIAGNGILGDAADGTPRLSGTIGSLRALTRDVHGNLFFSDADARRIRAVCLNVAVGAGYCAGKAEGALYRVAGTGAAGDGANNAVATAAAMGISHGLVVTASGNFLLSDSTYFRLRAVCQHTSSDSFCLGKTAGNSYQVYGTGVTGNGANGSLSASAAIGDTRQLAIDPAGNIMVADATNRVMRGFCVSPSAGTLCDGRLASYQYQLAGSGTNYMGWQVPAQITPIGRPAGIAYDAQGNVYFGDAQYPSVRVICYNTSDPGYCQGKALNTVYFLAGTGVSGNAVDNVSALTGLIGVPVGIALDSAGNVFVADSTNRMIRAICLKSGSGGYCNARAEGNMYRAAGNGVAGDGADNVLATGAVLGTVGGLQFDSTDNLWIIDNQYPRLRALCLNTAGFCTGKTAGNLYRVAGVGLPAADGADNAVMGTTGMGLPQSIAIDPWDNIFIGDASYFRLRLVCLNTNGGACATRTASRSYRITGTGVTGDGADAILASGAATGVPVGLATDTLGNVLVADETNRRVRAVCFDTTAGFCLGSTNNYAYRLFNRTAAVAGDPSSGQAGSQVRLDIPARNSLVIMPSGDILYSGAAAASPGFLRLFIGY